MDSQVLQKKLVFLEGQSTDRTRPLAAVDLLVAPQRSGPREALPADAAAKRFLSGVAPHVRLHVPERLSTDVAGFPVGLEMVEEVGGGPAEAAAHPADALRVGFHVIQLVRETFATAEAAVRRCRRLPPRDL